MGDALRVLALHHGVLWLDEVEREILGLRRTLDSRVEEFKHEDLREAIERLRNVDLVEYEEGFRATLSPSGAVRDLLVKLKDRSGVLTVLTSDDRFKRYLVERSRIYGRT